MKALFLSKKPLICFVSFSLGLIYLAFFVAVGKGVVSGGALVSAVEGDQLKLPVITMTNSIL